MKLRRVYETAEEEGKSVEEVAMDRFGSLEAFEEAQEERRILDEREGRRTSKAGSVKSKGKEPEAKERLVFTDVGASGASSRSSSFRRPDLGGSTPSTPSPAPGDAGRAARRGFDSLRLPSQGGTRSGLAQSHSPIPSVMTPTAALPSKTRTRALSPSSLNKLQAKVLRAKLMSAPNADSLEREYDEEVRKANTADTVEDTEVAMLPTLDARGRLYDVGQGKEDGPSMPGNRKKKPYVRYFLLFAVFTLTARFRWRQEILKLEILSESTLMTMKLLSARCCGRNDSTRVLRTRRALTWSLRKLLRQMEVFKPT